MGRYPGTNERARPTGLALKVYGKLLFPGGFGLFPGALGRFGDQTFLDRRSGDAHVAHFAIDEGLDALEIRHEAPLGNGGHVRADAALLLGLAAAPNDAALYRAFAGQFTKSSHTKFSKKE